MSSSDNKDSRSSRKKRKLEAASAEGAEYQFGRLDSAIGTPAKDMQSTIEQEKEGDQSCDDKNEESPNFGNHYNFYSGDDLDAAIEELIELEASGSISFEDVEYLME